MPYYDWCNHIESHVFFLINICPFQAGSHPGQLPPAGSFLSGNERRTRQNTNNPL